MRKIKYTTMINAETFGPIAICKMKLDNGELVTIFEKELGVENYTYLGKNYTRDEVEQIEFINEEISKLGMIPLSIEEADYMLNWNKLPEIEDSESIQRLAGFKVEKVITYFG